MGRRPCCSKQGLNRGAWSAREDKILINYIESHGEGKWRDLPQKAGLKRCGKSCRLRWLNYLRPDIKRGNISVEEEELIIRLHKLLGNRWSLIAGRLPGRTDNEIKNYWNTTLSKRVHANKISNKSCKKQPAENKLKDLENSSSEEKTAEGTKKSAQVIRTKAVRCSKVIIPQQRQDNCMIDNSTDDGASPSSLVPEEENSDDLLMDFDIGELLSDAPNSNLDLVQEKDINVNECDEPHEDNVMSGEYAANNLDDVSCCLNFPRAVHDESKLEALMEDSRPENWSPSDAFQPNEALDLENLETFLNSEEQWVF